MEKKTTTQQKSVSFTPRPPLLRTPLFPTTPSPRPQVPAPLHPTTSWPSGLQGQTSTYQNPVLPPMLMPSPRPLMQTPKPGLLGITVADFLASLQNQASLPSESHPMVSPNCTPVSVQPPMLVHPGGKGTTAQPPQLTQTAQQLFYQKDRPPMM